MGYTHGNHPVTRNCPLCGKEFMQPFWKAQRSRGYCSRACTVIRKHHRNRDKAYRVVGTRGYIRLYIPEHPRADKKGYVLESVVAYEKSTGVSVEKGMVVHHRDEDKSNNDPTNLHLCIDQAEHMRIHAAMRVAKRGGSPEIDSICSRCDKLKPKVEFHTSKRGNGTRLYCKLCQSLYYQERKTCRLKNPPRKQQ